MPNYSTENIPYEEYRAIAELRRLHPETHGGHLRALIVFGELVATGRSHDINLLEVVEGWEGPRHVSFGSTRDLPLRGQLHLYFLLPSEFERPRTAPLPGQSWSSAGLLTQVRQAFAVMLEEPNDYAAGIMAQMENSPEIGSLEQSVSSEGPANFFRRQGSRQGSVR